MWPQGTTNKHFEWTCRHQLSASQPKLLASHSGAALGDNTPLSNDTYSSQPRLARTLPEWPIVCSVAYFCGFNRRVFLRSLRYELARAAMHCWRPCDESRISFAWHLPHSIFRGALGVSRHCHRAPIAERRHVLSGFVGRYGLARGRCQHRGGGHCASSRL